MSVLQRLLPRQVDNRFEGHRLALWLLAILIGLKLIVSLNSMLNTESVAAGADGFPLDSYGADGARAVLMLFAIGAVANLTLAILGLTVLLRYRAMVPLIFLLSLFEHAGRRLIVQAYAVERAQGITAAFVINMAVLALLVIGLGLSLWPRKAAGSARSEETGEEAP